MPTYGTCVGTLQVKEGATPITENAYVYISDAPEMPDIRAQLTGAGTTGNVSWTLTVEYKRSNRNDTTTFSATLPVTQEWDVNFGTTFCGGKATIRSVHNNRACFFVFYIRGTNPTVDAAKAEIGTSPFYAKAIARQESGVQNSRSYLQFNEVGTLGPGWNDYQYCPNRSSDGTGWGMFQLDTPAPTVTQLWSWKANVAEAKARMTSHKTEADQWIASQVTQQMNDRPSETLDGKEFTWNSVVFKKDTTRTPEHACAIQRFNGVAGGWVIYWDNVGTNPPLVWKQRANSYLDAVCGFLSE